MEKDIFQNVSSFGSTSWILPTEISPNPASSYLISHAVLNWTICINKRTQIARD
jgi:hypothetical protein